MEPKRILEKPLKLAAVVIVAGGLAMAGACGGKKQAPPQAAPEVATVTVTAQKVELTSELPGRTVPRRSGHKSAGSSRSASPRKGPT